MTEETSNPVRESNAEWQAPPPSANITPETEPPQMSEAATLGNIFLEPGNTFEDLRRKPRFIIAGIIVMVLAFTFQFLFLQKMGPERIKRAVIEQMDKSAQVQAMSPEAKQSAVDLNLKIQGFVKYLIPVFVLVFLLIGGLIYWLGAKAMGGSMTFLAGLSVWIYSTFPPVLVSSIANIIVLFLKSADDIDITEGQRGLIHANPSLFLDGKSMPVLATLVSTIDLFAIWGLILAAIGLQTVGKISKGAAWGLVIIVTLIGISFRVIGAIMSGNPS